MPRKTLLERVPDRFKKGRTFPVAKTVGQLKKLLDELPASLPVEVGFGPGAQLCVCIVNGDESRPFLMMDEPDDDS